MRGLGRLLALPIVVLGLLLQINAPAQAMAAGRTAAILQTMLCADGTGRETAPAKGKHDGAPCEHCTACSIAPAALLDTGVAVPVPISRRAERTAEVAVVGPRGPPAVVPKARGPPTAS